MAASRKPARWSTTHQPYTVHHDISGSADVALGIVGGGMLPPLACPPVAGALCWSPKSAPQFAIGSR
eukprot:scaffold92088_cov31-Tisochrysis_lutea.AAC.4